MYPVAVPLNAHASIVQVRICWYFCIQYQCTCICACLVSTRPARANMYIRVLYLRMRSRKQFSARNIHLDLGEQSRKKVGGVCIFYVSLGYHRNVECLSDEVFRNLLQRVLLYVLQTSSLLIPRID